MSLEHTGWELGLEEMIKMHNLEMKLKQTRDLQEKLPQKKWL